MRFPFVIAFAFDLSTIIWMFGIIPLASNRRELTDQKRHQIVSFPLYVRIPKHGPIRFFVCDADGSAISLAEDA